MAIVDERSGIDPLLVPLISCATTEEANTLIAEIIDANADPVIRSVIRYKLGFSATHSAGQADAEDLRQESVLQLLTELRKFREQPEAHVIRDLRGLAAVIAHRACAGWMRRRFPERHALKYRLYHILTHRQEFAVWRDEKERLLAGFVGWKRQRLDPIGRVPEFASDVRFSDRIQRINSGAAFEEMSDVLDAIFTELGRPVEFDKLVGALAAFPSAAQREYSIDLAESRAPDTAWQVEKKIFLERLWQELQSMPRHHRAALLLNLKDSGGVSCIALFPLTGVATIRQLAQAVEMPPEAFAEIWNQLPLEDAKIAELLQLTRQQVINARKSARERLARQLKGFM